MNCLVYYCDANVKISVGRFYKRAKCKFFGAILLLQTIGPMLSKYAVEYFAILILISFADVIVMGKSPPLRGLKPSNHREGILFANHLSVVHRLHRIALEEARLSIKDRAAAPPRLYERPGRP